MAHTIQRTDIRVKLDHDGFNHLQIFMNGAVNMIIDAERIRIWIVERNNI
jgi:hypothetical protein